MRPGKKAKKILDAAYEKHIYNAKELSYRMGWCEATCSKKINNPMTMTLDEAKKICKLTGLTFEDLVKIGGHM